MIKITCPHCGAEYLPAEIFYPDEFFGRPMNISKNSKGRIDFYSGNSLNLNETYICDYCDRKMTVKTFINFTTTVPQSNPRRITQFKKSNLKLEEK